jgi:hypothetical protein
MSAAVSGTCSGSFTADLAGTRRARPWCRGRTTCPRRLDPRFRPACGGSRDALADFAEVGPRCRSSRRRRADPESTAVPGARSRRLRPPLPRSRPSWPSTTEA